MKTHHRDSEEPGGYQQNGLIDHTVREFKSLRYGPADSSASSRDSHRNECRGILTTRNRCTAIGQWDPIGLHMMGSCGHDDGLDETVVLRASSVWLAC